MKINAIQGCQPIKQPDFGKKAQKNIIISDPIGDDSFTSLEADTYEQKYNMACRLAAYYKLQYENLLNDGCCEA